MADDKSSAQDDKNKDGNAGGEADNLDSKDTNNLDDRKIDPADHRRAVEDMLKYKAELKKLRDEAKARDTASLKDQEKWKELAEKTEQERNEALTRAEESEKVFTTTIKYAKVSELAAKAGIRPEAVADLELLSLDAIEVEKTSSGRFTIRGAESFVENLKKQKSHWFQDKTPPKFNGGGGRPPADNTPTEMTMAELNAIEAKYGTKSKAYKDAYEAYTKVLVQSRRKQSQSA